MTFFEAYEEIKKGKTIRRAATSLSLVCMSDSILRLWGFMDGEPKYDRYYLSCKDIEATDWEVVE